MFIIVGQVMDVTLLAMLCWWD